MEPDISHKVSVMNLRPGDYIIASDTRAFLIKNICWGMDDETLHFTCCDETENTLSTELNWGAHVDAIINTKAPNLEGTFGIKECQECNVVRMPFEWRENDYICIPCRKVLGLDS